MNGSSPHLRSDGEGLLERAIGYARGVLPTTEVADLSRATPCAEWDLGSLLAHVADSVAAIGDGLALGEVVLPRPADQPAGERVAAIRLGLGRILGSLHRRHNVLIGDCNLADFQLVAVAAVEIAVHGWDISAACGRAAPIPTRLARRLLEVASRLIDDHGRDGQFGPAVPTSPSATANDRLLAYLGRRPAPPADRSEGP